jgi:hypothetical protein
LNRLQNSCFKIGVYISYTITISNLVPEQLYAQETKSRQKPSSITILNNYDYNYNQLGLVPYSFGIRYDKTDYQITDIFFGRQKGNIYPMNKFTVT